MQNKIDNNYNLLQEIFDLVWYKLFPDDKPKTTKEELQELFPTLPKEVKYKLPSKEDKLKFRIPIGESFNNKIVYWNPNSIPHVLCCGATGSGKSVCTKSILSSILNMFDEKQIEVTLIDFKIIELNAFRNCKQVIKYTYEVNEGIEIIADTLDECRNRYKLFQEYEVTNLIDFNKKSKNKLKYQFIFIEEFIVLSQHKNGIKMLNELISLSRAAGIFIYISCQRPDHTIISNIIKCNVGNKICFRTEDSKNSVIILDKEGGEKLEGCGHGLLKQGSKITEFRGYYISDEQVKEFIKPYIKSKSKIENKPIDNKTIEETNKTSLRATQSLTEAKDNIIDLSFLEKI